MLRNYWKGSVRQSSCNSFFCKVKIRKEPEFNLLVSESLRLKVFCFAHETREINLVFNPVNPLVLSKVFCPFPPFLYIFFQSVLELILL